MSRSRGRDKKRIERFIEKGVEGNRDIPLSRIKKPERTPLRSREAELKGAIDFYKSYDADLEVREHRIRGNEPVEDLQKQRGELLSAKDNLRYFTKYGEMGELEKQLAEGHPEYEDWRTIGQQRAKARQISEYMIKNYPWVEVGVPRKIWKRLQPKTKSILRTQMYRELDKQILPQIRGSKSIEEVENRLQKIMGREPLKRTTLRFASLIGIKGATSKGWSLSLEKYFDACEGARTVEDVKKMLPKKPAGYSENFILSIAQKLGIKEASTEMWRREKERYATLCKKAGVESIDDVRGILTKNMKNPPAESLVLDVSQRLGIKGASSARSNAAYDRLARKVIESGEEIQNAKDVAMFLHLNTGVESEDVIKKVVQRLGFGPTKTRKLRTLDEVEREAGKAIGKKPAEWTTLAYGVRAGVKGAAAKSYRKGLAAYADLCREAKNVGEVEKILETKMRKKPSTQLVFKVADELKISGTRTAKERYDVNRYTDAIKKSKEDVLNEKDVATFMNLNTSVRSGRTIKKVARALGVSEGHKVKPDLRQEILFKAESLVRGKMGREDAAKIKELLEKEGLQTNEGNIIQTAAKAGVPGASSLHRDLLVERWANLVKQSGEPVRTEKDVKQILRKTTGLKSNELMLAVARKLGVSPYKRAGRK
ncbi:MAG: hypothetical protein V1911_03095 [Candidatus Micrarchaeota archaeon]